MAGITGIGSGLDVKGIVAALVGAERAPKDAQLGRLEKVSTTRFTALGQLKSAASALQTALKDLNKPELFSNRTANSSDSKLVTASATNTAQAGAYQLEVRSLATSSKVATAAMSSSFTAAADGALQVSLGSTGTPVNVGITAGDDLTTIRDKLNTALKDQGVSANLVNDPSSGTSRLVLTAKEAGAGKDIFISASSSNSGSPAGLEGFVVDNPSPVSAAPYDPVVPATFAAGYITQAADAEFAIDGLTLFSASNSISNAIPDVTLNLVKAERGTNLTVTVGQDTAGVKGSIKKFVDAYNALITTSNQLTGVTSAGEGKPPVVGGLVGDASVRNLLGGLRSELGNPTAGGGDGLRVLADLGITTQKDGTLKLDDSTFDQVLSDNYDAVGVFITGETGLMARLDSRVNGFVQTGGILEQRMNSLQATIKDIDKQKENLNLRIVKVQERLLNQFNAMDSLVGRLNNTSGQLAQALASLPGVARKD